MTLSIELCLRQFFKNALVVYPDLFIHPRKMFVKYQNRYNQLYIYISLVVALYVHVVKVILCDIVKQMYANTIYIIGKYSPLVVAWCTRAGYYIYMYGVVYVWWRGTVTEATPAPPKTLKGVDLMQKYLTVYMSYFQLASDRSPKQMYGLMQTSIPFCRKPGTHLKYLAKIFWAVFEKWVLTLYFLGAYN